MNSNKLSKGLGWFSFALGAVQLLAGRRLSRTSGDGTNHPKLMNGLGLWEIISAIGLLTGRQKSPWRWSRVGGNAVNLSLLVSALFGGKSKKGRIGATIASVAAVALLDYFAARTNSRRNK